MKDFALRVKSVPTDKDRLLVVARGVITDDAPYRSITKAIDGLGSVEIRVLRMLLSDQLPDRGSDIVHQDGWDLSNFKSNPVVLFGHDYGSFSCARDQEVVVEGRQLIGNPGFFRDDISAFSDAVYKQLRVGLLNACSVGFRPLEWTYDEERNGYDVLKAELYEYSIVPIPANPRALLIAREKGIDVKPLTEWAEKALAGVFGAGSWVPKADLETAYFLVNGNKMFSVPRIALKDVNPEDVREILTGQPALTDADGTVLRHFLSADSPAEPTVGGDKGEGSAAGTAEPAAEDATATAGSPDPAPETQQAADASAETPAADEAAATDTANGGDTAAVASAPATDAPADEASITVATLDSKAFLTLLADPAVRGQVAEILRADATLRAHPATETPAPVAAAAAAPVVVDGEKLVRLKDVEEILKEVGVQVRARLKAEREELIQTITGRMPD